VVRRVASPTFVGRSEELAALTDGLERAAAGEPAAFLIGGEAGVGKSRLLSELMAHAGAAGARVAVGGCVALRSGALPLLPVAEALRQLAESDEEVLRRALADAPAELGALLPRRGEAPAPSRAASPEALFEHVVMLLRRVAETVPLVLAVEDLHWADRSTLDLLAFLLRALGGARLLVVATYRDDEVDEAAGLRAWLGDAGRLRGVERLSLRRFSREPVDELLAGILGAPPDPELAAGIFARSEGNAFLAEELLAAARGGDADEIPETARDSLLTRLAALTEGGHRVAKAAAAAGGPVHHELLATVTGRPGEDFDAALADTLRRHVLVLDRPGERASFRHALLREVAYEQLLPAERARIHAAYADAIEARPDLAGGNPATVAAELAHHAFESGDAPRALDSAVRAGVEAERLHAPAEALEQFERALSLWDRAGTTPELDRAEVAARAAAAAEAHGSADRAVALVEQAIGLVVDPVRAGLLHERRAWYLDRAGLFEASHDAYETAIGLVPPDPPSAERARVLASSAYKLARMWRVPEARERASEALAVARTAGAAAEEATALLAFAAVHTALGELEENVEYARRGLDIAKRLGDDMRVAPAAINLSDALLAVGRADEALVVALDGVERCRRAGLALTYGNIALTNAALSLLHLGRWDEAGRLLTEALERALSGLGAASILSTLAKLEILRGDLAAAESHLREAPEQVAGDLPTEWKWDLSVGRATLALWRGDLDTPVAELLPPLTVLAETREPTFLPQLSALIARVHAERADAIRRRDAAAARHECERAREVARIAATARGYHGPEQAAFSAVIAGECSRAEGAADPACWAAAVTACEAWGDVYQTAYARWRHGEALLAAHAPRAEAAEVLRPAHETALRLAARPLAGEIEALARRARIDLAPSPEPAASEPDPWGLTVREHEVLEHVAAGETNRQIAEALFISVKTAGVHVSSILRKLDAATRAEAAGIAHREGLLIPRPGSAHRV
jgi:DNA-binding CsgD family transcriptional regulator/tetratricopeptide (TPR) repeat protein